MVDKSSADKCAGLQADIYNDLIASHVENYTKDSTVSLEEVARRRSVCTPESGAFLFSFPYGDCRLPPKNFVAAVQYRLGMNLSLISADNVVCSCKKKGIVDRRGYHLSICGVGDEIYNRHNSMAKCLKILVARAGIKCNYNPRGVFYKSTDKNIQPDLHLQQPGVLCGNGSADISIDVRITDPVATSHVGSDSIMLSELEKIRKYKVHADAAGYVFMPIVVETFGRWSEQLQQLVKGLVKRIFEMDPDAMCESRLMHYWRKRISTVLQRYQSELFLARYHRLAIGLNGKECSLDECVVDTVMNDVAL